MCMLISGSTDVNNLLIFKIHGGITKGDIHAQVRKSIRIARENKLRGVDQTVLFFDEANTTSAISTIKTVMCDGFVDGERIPADIGLRFVAAVNPYRQHSHEMIQKLENAGLGYHIEVSRAYKITQEVVWKIRLVKFQVKVPICRFIAWEPKDGWFNLQGIGRPNWYYWKLHAIPSCNFSLFV